MNKSLIPFGSLRDLWDGRDVFDSFFPALLNRNGLWKDSGRSFWIPAVDIYNKKDKLVVKVEIPGIDKKDVKLDIDRDVLTISGESKNEEEVKEKEYYYIERTYGSFSRSIRLPEKVQKDKATAKFKSGVLTVDLPKSKEDGSAGREIEVE